MPSSVRNQPLYVPVGLSIMTPRTRAMRRMLFLCVFLFVACTGIFLFADYLWRTHLYGLKYAMLILYSILFSLISFLFCNGLFGFVELRLRERHASRAAAANADESADKVLAPTCILFPVYNEDVSRVMAGLTAIWQSVKETGRLDAFDFFVLSDSTRPDCWVQEEIAWFETTRQLDADNIHYRHRPDNTGMKSGNITHILERWGAGYKYMIIMDADSLMTGSALIKLVRLMETHPQVGIIQTNPLVVRAETLYGRIQQFAAGLYSRVFSAGTSFWQGCDGNYMGHNAIVRVKPFMDHCRLPELPWKEPLGGHIYSHDFVEAALMRKNGYEIWLADEIGDSYEEAPANLIAGAWRHRRWCQGDLQHGWLLFSRDLPLMNRCHFLLGILGYTSCLLWFVMLLFGTLIVVQFERSGLSMVPSSGFTRFLNISLTQHGLLLFGLAFALLLSPKFLSLADLCMDRRRLEAWGGFWRCLAGVGIEMVFSVMTAPLLMIWHAFFVVSTLTGRGTKWIPQSRDPHQRLTWRLAGRTHAWITVIAGCWLLVDYAYGLNLFRWMLLITGPLFVSIPLNMLVSSIWLGQWLRDRGLLITPEERNPTPELLTLNTAEESVRVFLEAMPRPASCLALADPYVNALHVAVQRQTGDCVYMQEKEAWSDRLQAAQSPEEAWMRNLLLDDEACLRMHHALWNQPDSALSDDWRRMLTAYQSRRSACLTSRRKQKSRKGVKHKNFDSAVAHR